MMKYYPVLLLFLAGALHAQVSEEAFDSFYLQQSRDLVYYLPEDYDPETKYPLILVLDAEYLFDLVVANARFYSTYYRMPESIIVGVKQGSHDLRWYDCDFEQTTGLPTERAMSFYDFLSKELIPDFEKRFSIAPFKMFIGYDITANFGNYFLFADRSLFTSYLIISPLLAQEMESRVPARMSALDQQLFYNLVLEKDPSEDRARILQMNNGIRSVQKETLHYFFDEYSAPDHISIATYGISKAFDNVFRLFRPITEKEYEEHIVGGQGPVFAYLLDKYEMLEELLGFRKSYELGDLMHIYAGSKAREDVESMKFLLKAVRKAFPETMMGDFIEGELFELEGNYKKALKSYGRAYSLAEIAFFTKDLAYNKIASIKAQGY